MHLPPNSFKKALAGLQHQTGFWCMLASPYAAEIVAGAGFDWLLLDMEHSPSGMETVLGQLQAIAAYGVQPVVRPASNDPVLIKHVLDAGAQTLLVPYVQSASEAQSAVAAIRYPPEGFRGVSGATRASRFGRIKDYGRTASNELCLILQIETLRALDNLDEIARVEGVDGLFVGPADLAASLGHAGEPSHPTVTTMVLDTIRRIRACGKPAGVLSTDNVFAKECMVAGSIFTAVGVDIAVLARGADRLAAEFCGSGDPKG